jgi:hypothetical protein
MWRHELAVYTCLHNFSEWLYFENYIFNSISKEMYSLRSQPAGQIQSVYKLSASVFPVKNDLFKSE